MSAPPPEKIPFTDYINRLADLVGEPPRVDANVTTWERGSYRVVLIDTGDGSYNIQFQTKAHLTYGLSSATLPERLPNVADWVKAFLGGPEPARHPPERLPLNEQLIESLQKRLRRVQQQVTLLMQHRRWDGAYLDIISRNQSLLGRPNSLLWHFHRVYIDYAVLAIRRQSKRDKEAYSLIGIIDSVLADATVITREWHHRLWRGEAKTPYTSVGWTGPFVFRNADQVFEQFGGPHGDHVDQHLVRKDLDEFEAGTRAIVDYADKTTAHDDRRGFDEAKYNEDELNLDKAIQTVERFTSRYSKLLLGPSPERMTPVDFDSTLAVFRSPWIATEADAHAIREKLDFLKGPETP